LEQAGDGNGAAEALGDEEMEWEQPLYTRFDKKLGKQLRNNLKRRSYLLRELSKYHEQAPSPVALLSHVSIEDVTRETTQRQQHLVAMEEERKREPTWAYLMAASAFARGEQEGCYRRMRPGRYLDLPEGSESKQHRHWRKSHEEYTMECIPLVDAKHDADEYDSEDQEAVMSHPYHLGTYRFARDRREEQRIERQQAKNAVPISLALPAHWHRTGMVWVDESMAEERTWRRKMKRVCRAVRSQVPRHMHPETHTSEERSRIVASSLPVQRVPFSRRVAATRLQFQPTYWNVGSNPLAPYSRWSVEPQCEAVGVFQFRTFDIDDFIAKGRRLTGEAILKRFNEETAEYLDVKRQPVSTAPIFGPLAEVAMETPEEVYHEHLIKLALVTSTLAVLERKREMALPIHEVKHFMTAEPESEGASNPNRNLTYLKTRVRSRKFKREGDKELTSPTNVDGGASITVVDEDYAKYINADVVRAHTPVRIRAVNGGVTLCRNECRLFLDFEGLDLEGTPAINTMEVTCVVMPGCSTPRWVEHDGMVSCLDGFTNESNNDG
jgi:hypothetical protein